jgi:hypothetical protein
MGRTNEFSNGTGFITGHPLGETLAERNAAMHESMKQKSITGGWAKDSADYERQYAEARQESRDSD